MFNGFNTQAQPVGLVASLHALGGRCDQPQDRHGVQGGSMVLKWIRHHGWQDWSGGATSVPMTTSPPKRGS